jgi:hypothetical protein
MNATETYQARRQEINAKLIRIQDLLKTMDNNQADDRKNWGYAGSAGYIKEQLDGIITHLTGEEA